MLALAPACAADAPATPSAQAAPADLPFQKDVKPLLEKYCYECHGDGEAKGDVALDSYHSTIEVLKDRPTWETVLKNVSTRQMPPDDADEMPTLTEREQLSSWLERELFKYDPAHPDPGHITLHRLNRAEYNNTIRDLVGVDFKPADDFPLDDSGYGFDNISDVLSLPPLLMEKYLAAADKVLGQAIVTDPIPSRVQRFQANLSQVGFNAIGDRGDGWVQLISLEEDDVAVELPVLAAGDYLVRVQAFARPAGGAMVGGGNNNRENPPADPEPTKLALQLNDAVIQEFTLTTDEAHPGVYEARIGIPAGKQNVRAVVRRIRGGANELIMVNGRLGKQQPGIVFVKWIEVEGPLPTATRRFPASQLTVTGPGTFTPKGARVLEHPGEVGLKINADHEGDYLLRAQAYAMQAGTEPARMEFRLDGQAVKTFDVLAPGNMRPLDSQRVFSLALLVPPAAGLRITRPPQARRKLFLRRLRQRVRRSGQREPQPPHPLAHDPESGGRRPLLAGARPAAARAAAGAVRRPPGAVGHARQPRRSRDRVGRPRYPRRLHPPRLAPARPAGRARPPDEALRPRRRKRRQLRRRREARHEGRPRLAAFPLSQRAATCGGPKWGRGALAPSLRPGSSAGLPACLRPCRPGR